MGLAKRQTDDLGQGEGRAEGNKGKGVAARGRVLREAEEGYAGLAYLWAGIEETGKGMREGGLQEKPWKM